MRRGGWHERDLNFDRFITLPEGEFRLPHDVYLVQDTPEIYNSLDQVTSLRVLILSRFSRTSGRFLSEVQVFICGRVKISNQ